MIRVFQAIVLAPLAWLSFLFHGIVRWVVLRVVAAVFARQARAGAPAWRFFSELVSHPLPRYFALVTGPRWNCHAALCDLGPLRVNHHLRVNVADARASAGHWSFVVYTADYRLAAALGSATAAQHEPWQEIVLAPGTYRVSLRYYHCTAEGRAPEVWIDDARWVQSRALGDETARYARVLEGMRGGHNVLFSWQHFYIYYLLRYAPWLPREFIRREYLPVGDPQTHFLYGALGRGDRLHILSDAAPTDPQDAPHVFYTFYNISSFPVSWQAAAQPHTVSEPAPCNGHYLVRILGCETGPAGNDLESIRELLWPVSDRASGGTVRDRPQRFSDRYLGNVRCCVEPSGGRSGRRSHLAHGPQDAR